MSSFALTSPRTIAVIRKASSTAGLPSSGVGASWQRYPRVWSRKSARRAIRIATGVARNATAAAAPNPTAAESSALTGSDHPRCELVVAEVLERALEPFAQADGRLVPELRARLGQVGERVPDVARTGRCVDRLDVRAKQVAQLANQPVERHPLAACDVVGLPDDVRRVRRQEVCLHDVGDV